MIKSQIPSVSVIIACRNEAEHIQECLECLLKQDYPADKVEIIIADGMSDDGTRGILDSFQKSLGNIKVLDNPNRITSSGLNLAIGQSRGEVIIRIDAHSEYENTYISRCIDGLRASWADNVGGPWRAQGVGYIGRAVAAAFNSIFAIGGGRAHRLNYEGPVDTVYLGCWPSASFEKYGLFDEELVRNQDDEHNLRIVRGGGVVWQSPKIKSFYRPRNTLRELFRQYIQYGYWKVRVIRKHHLPASVRHVIPGLFLLILFLLLLFGLIYPGALWIFFTLLGIYAIFSLLFSIESAHRGGWDILPVMPIIFGCYHFGYGYGFIRGVLDFVIFQRKPKPEWAALTRDSKKIV
jgi:succinoglycan biosynthesis protein ExoA